MAGGTFGNGPDEEFKELVRRGKNLKAEGQWAEAISKFARGVRVARGANRFDWEIKAYRLIGDTLFKKGDTDKAVGYYTKAMDLAKRKDDKLGLAHTYRGLGSIHVSKGDLDKAEEYFKYFVEVAEKIKHQVMMGLGHVDMANIAVEREDLGTAMELYKKGIDLLERTEEHEEIARAYSSLGDAFRMAGDYGTALTYFEKAMAECSKYGNIHTWALAEVKVAECCTKLGFVVRAMESLESSREVLMRLKDNAGLGEVYRISGILMTSQGNWNAAEVHFKKSVKLLKEADRPVPLANAFIEIGRMYLIRGEMGKSRTVFEKAKELAEKVESKRLGEMADRLLQEAK